MMYSICVKKLKTSGTHSRHEKKQNIKIAVIWGDYRVGENIGF